MNLDRLITYAKEINVGIRTRENSYVHKRMYVYQILFFHFGFTLKKIGAMFPFYNNKEKCKNNWDHTTVRNSLIRAYQLKDDKDFITNTKELKELFPFEMKEYFNQYSGTENKNYEVTVPLTKDQYINYMKGRDINYIYDILWNMTLDKIKNRVSQIK